jgi:phosphatidylglycerophosphate synthase
MKTRNRIQPFTRIPLMEGKPAGEIRLASPRYRPQPESQSLRAYMGKHIADGLTLSRVLLGLFLAGSGVMSGKPALAQEIWILVVAWSTDMVDGRISRWSKNPRQTWLGKNDVYVDMFMAVTVLIYLVATGLLPIAIVGIYLLVWGALFWRWGIPPLFAQVFQNPIYAYFVVMTVIAAPFVLPWLLAWATASAALFWRRLLELAQSVFRAILQRNPSA